jgi:hypothetical protein
MKKIVCLLSVVITGSILATEKIPLYRASAEEFKARRAEYDALSESEKEDLKKKRIAYAHEKAGGMLRDTRNMTGRIVIINAQKKVPTDKIAEVVSWTADFLKVQMEVIDGDYVSRDASYAWRQKNKANALIIVCDDGSNDTLLIAPEKRWGSVNISTFVNKNLESRTQKEVSRAIAYVCGGMSSQYNPTLGSQIDDADALDNVRSCRLPIDLLMSVGRYLPQLGVQPYRNVIYRKAVREGWAPAPTNDVQKAIWEKVRSEKERGPTNPIEIPMPKKK